MRGCSGHGGVGGFWGGWEERGRGAQAGRWLGLCLKGPCLHEAAAERAGWLQALDLSMLGTLGCPWTPECETPSLQRTHMQ